MTDAAKRLRYESTKRWKQAHPDRVKIHNERYWEKKAKEAAERQTEKSETDNG